jgi:hypothetical protein
LGANTQRYYHGSVGMGRTGGQRYWGVRGGQKKRVRRGQGVTMAWLFWMGMVPEWLLDGALKGMSGMKDLKRIVKGQD